MNQTVARVCRRVQRSAKDLQLRAKRSKPMQGKVLVAVEELRL